jgi:hypothetical protein
MWVAADGAVSSGVLRMPVRREAGRGGVSQPGWQDISVYGSGDGGGGGDNKMVGFVPPAPRVAKAAEARLSSESESVFKGYPQASSQDQEGMPPLLPPVLKPAVLLAVLKPTGGAAEARLSVCGGSVLSGYSDSEVA